MRPEQWISALVAAAGFVGWMTALWIRAGRILQRIDDLVGDQQALKGRVEQHEARLTRVEILMEQNR
jgi:hypothetical protein